MNSNFTMSVAVDETLISDYVSGMDWRKLMKRHRYMPQTIKAMLNHDGKGDERREQRTNNIKLRARVQVGNKQLANLSSAKWRDEVSRNIQGIKAELVTLASNQNRLMYELGQLQSALMAPRNAGLLGGSPYVSPNIGTPFRSPGSSSTYDPTTTMLRDPMSSLHEHTGLTAKSSNGQG